MSIQDNVNDLLLKLNQLEAHERDIEKLEADIKQLSSLQHQHQGAVIRFDSGRRCDEPIVCLEGPFTLQALEEIIAVFSINRDLQSRFSTK